METKEYASSPAIYKKRMADSRFRHFMVHNLYNPISANLIKHKLIVFDKRKTFQQNLNCKGMLGFRHFIHLPKVYANEGKTVSNDSRTQISPMPDIFKKPASVISDSAIQEYLAKETGWERVKDMWGKDFKGDHSLEFELTSLLAGQSILVGFFLGSYFGARESKEDYIDKAKASKFHSRFRALRGMHDASIIGGTKEGLRWGFKIGGFATIFLVTTQTISAYRNKNNVLDFTAGGALAGSVYKCNMGLRGMLVAGALGGVLGTLAGTMIYTGLKFTNQTTDQRHYFRVQEKLQQDRFNTGLVSVQESMNMEPPKVEAIP